jgi:hypothetical protein
MGTGRPQGEGGTRVTTDAPVPRRLDCYIYVYHLVYQDVFVGRSQQSRDFGGNSTRSPQRARWTPPSRGLVVAIPHSPKSYMIVDANNE